MEALVPIAVWIVIALVGLGIISILLFGLRSLLNGKIDKMSILFIALPIVIMVALGFGLGDWAMAGIYTLLIMIGLAILAMFWTSIQGVFR